MVPGKKLIILNFCFSFQNLSSPLLRMAPIRVRFRFRVKAFGDG